MTLLLLTPDLLSNGIPQVQNIIDQLPNHPTKVYAKRDLSKVTTLIVHHMASEAPLINQAKYHVNGRGWPRIGYHIVIFNDRIYQTNYLDTESYHTSGNNRIGIGIAILGDLSKRSITPRERELLAAVLASLRAIVPDAEIKGHNQLVRTTCPATDMNVIREDVSTLELKLAVTDTASDQLAKVFALRTRIEDLYQLAIKEGKFQSEAQRKLNRVSSIMESEGLL